MERNRPPSKSTLKLLAALLTDPDAARYGYELMKTTGIKSGTLYPILMRLEARGFLTANWREPAHPGRPPRHAYSLTSDGLAFAKAALDPAHLPQQASQKTVQT